MIPIEIVTVCGDPGGANALAPVIELLQAKKVPLKNYAYNEGVKVLKRHQLKCIILPESVDEHFILKQLQADRPKALLVATSHNQKNWEKKFIKVAKHLEINSLAVLDFWSNYLWRFSENEADLTCLPDMIAVMDERAKEEMVKLGIPAHLMLISGQPAFDKLAEYKKQFMVHTKQAVRQELGIFEAEKFILFNSQPLRQLYGSPDSSTYLGYDEHTTLPLVIDRLEKISHINQQAIHLVIRPHPRESVEDYRHYQSTKIKISVSQAGNHYECVMSADLVLGMNTVLLVEACYLGCMVLSLQPGLSKPDVLPLDTLGLNISVYQQNEIYKKIESYLFDKKTRSVFLSKMNMLNNQAGATDQIVEYLLSTFRLVSLS